MQRLNDKQNEVAAFIGFGMSGLSEFCSYVDEAIAKNKKPTIFIYEKDAKYLATGMPFNIDAPPVWLLNGPPASDFAVPAGGITLQSWINDNRAVWSNKFSNVNEKYPPRALIGYYFKSQYALYKQKALDNGIKIEERIEEVTDLEVVTDDQIILQTASGKTSVNYVGLGLGNLMPDQFQSFNGLPGFVGNPWDPTQLATLKDADEVVVIGGHLTFIDTIKYLVLEQQFKGHITTVSRHPTVIVMRDVPAEIATEPTNEFHKTVMLHKNSKLTINQASTLFWDTYRASVKHPITERTSIHDGLANQLAELDGLTQPYSSHGNVSEMHKFIINFIVSGTYFDLWKALDANAQEEFDKQFFSMILAYLSAIPPVNARFLTELFERDRLHEMSGVTGMTYDTANQEFVISFKEGAEKRAKHVINATGQGRDITKHFHEHPLLKNLFDRGLITMTKFGGLLTNDENQLITKSGQPTANIIAIGPYVFKGAPSSEANFFITNAASRAVMAHFRR